MGNPGRILLPLFSILLLFQACDTGIEQHIGYLERALNLEQEKLDTIWPGYNFEEFAIAIYNDDEAYLVNHPEPGPEFRDTGRKIAGMTLFHAAEKIPQFNANTSITYNDKTTSIFRVTQGMRAATFYNLLFHEVFHSYAESVPGILKRAGNLLLQPFFPATDAEYYALAFVEQRILQDAVISQNSRDSEILFREYLAVNSVRTARTDSSFAEYEAEEQINEGIAEYAGYKGLQVMGFDRTAEENFRVTIENRIEEPADFRLRTYGTGCAMAILLDRFYPEWKTELTLEKTLDEMLAGKVSAEEEIDVPLLLRQRNIDAYMPAFETALKKYAEKQNSLRAGITSVPHITIQFPHPEFANIYFDPMNITSAGDGLLYHSRFVKLFNKKTEFEIELNGNPAMTEFESDNMFRINAVVYPVPKDFTLTIDGSPAAIEKDTEFEELELTAQGLTMKMKSGELKTVDGNIVITVGKRNVYSKHSNVKILLTSTM